MAGFYNQISAGDKLRGINSCKAETKRTCNPAIGLFIEDSSRLISWDETFTNIENQENIRVEFDEYKSKFLVFNDPINFGNLRIYDFKIRYPDLRFNRADVPLDSIWNRVKIIDDEGYVNYFKIKEILSEVLGQPSPCYEREDAKASHWTRDHVNFCITCGENAELYLNIENNRNYEHLIPECDVNYGPHDVIKFRGNGFYIDFRNFRRSIDIYKTSEAIKKIFDKDIVSLMWIDNDCDTLGFSDIRYSSLFKLQELKSVSLQNELPARGGGGSFLFIDYYEKCQKIGMTITTELYSFEKYIDSMKTMLGKKFVVLEPTYNA